MATPDDFSPRYVGDLSRPLLVTFVDHEGNADPLTGATNLLLQLQNTANGAVTNGTGTWTITNAAEGQATYAWAVADVAQAGTFLLQVSAMMPDGPAHWDYKLLQILAAL